MSVQPSQLSDDALLAKSRALVEQIAACEAELCAVIAEIEQRELHLEEDCKSINAFCTKRLALSPSVANSRIAVGRLSLVVPDVLGLLTAPRELRIPLSGLAALAPHVTAENAPALLARACGRTKQQISALIASLPTYRPRCARERTAESASAASPAGAEQTVTLTLDRGLEADIEDARRMLRVEIPDGDLSKIVAWALRAALRVIEVLAFDDEARATGTPEGVGATRGPGPVTAPRLLKKQRLWPGNQGRNWGA